ncbi:hypothetical protein [Schaalia cardiffensis]|uniref:hypothetical protein n=1 Tax=Schaalia cardiffensis TaxID=181487 RepID=UPI0023EF73AE|nr:hypothetical protein [Schaalia cardiffensis]
MRISLTLALDIKQDKTPQPEPEPEPQPEGSYATIEHANHDSTPRMLGFTPNATTWEGA